ncbi:MAG: tRNA pseudouridine(13) synthase TruD [Porticoccaceae bacterium]|nr:tRNA pseudouridine(13) synthase TruD [Porticoccaceae bacterium]
MEQISKADPVAAADFSLDFPFALEAPRQRADFRRLLEDFQVVEDLGFEPSGEGEHLYIRIRKRNENTRWIAGLLARHFAVDEHAVGYCGLKDRRALTTQWFSVQLPGKSDFPIPQLPGCEILATGRHGKKLRPGMHKGNQFSIVLRFDGDVENEVEQRLAALKAQGAPNYFGEQRFGIDANNLREVAAIVARKHPRFQGKRGGLYLSAARSWLFNIVLADRVRSGSWRAVASGPLWGRGRSSAEATLAAEEASILQPWQSWCLALEHSGLRQERRPLVLAPENFQWQWLDGCLTLDFGLPPGTYATALLREVAQLRTCAEPGAE